MTFEDKETKVYSLDDVVNSDFFPVVKGSEYFNEKQFNIFNPTNGLLSTSIVEL